ncbi:MAG: hypothetical protein J5808_01780 [Paludibacteraceae bacterium]|nr:hypothetical protein [Paludibacteraceae bacterium]
MSTSAIISLAIAIACCYGCYTIAKKNGRNPILAAILGFFFSIIALIIYLIIGKK